MVRRPGIVGPLFLSFCALIASAVAAQEPSRPVTREEILARLSRGEDASELFLSYAASRANGPRRPTKLRSGDVEELESALRAFVLQAKLAVASGASGATLERLSAVMDSLDALRAADLLSRERFETVQTTLEEGGAAGDIVARATAAQQTYRQVIEAVLDPLVPAFESIREASSSGEALPAGAAADAISALASAIPLLEARLTREPVTVLRAGVFPYRQSRLLSRAVVTEPTVVPSYLDTADVLPTQEDQQGSAEAPLEEAILQKAAELGYDYVKIFEFVRNDIETEWYAGGMKGAVKALRDGRGNDVDQASLLLALLRASGAPGRYVHGVVERAVDDLSVEMGVPPEQVTTALARAGVAYEPVVRGGRVGAVRVEHSWVSAYVPYTNYRGAVVDFSGKVWVPLAPAIETYSRTPATSILGETGFSASTFLSDSLSAVYPEEPLTRIRQLVVDYLDQNPDAGTYDEQLGGRSVVREVLGLLPASLPVTVVAVTGESPTLDDAHQQYVMVRVRAGEAEGAPVVLEYEAPVYEVLGERFTLSYQPASVDDHKAVNLFGGLDSVPLYLIRLRPRILVRGRPEAVGREAIDPGARQLVEVELWGPFGSERVGQTVVAGSYHAIGVTGQRDRREADSGDDPAESEFLAARLLSGLALDYNGRWGAAEEELSGLLDVAVVRPMPAVTIASNAVAVRRLFDLPAELTFEGVTLDAALRIAEPISRGTPGAALDWMRLSALQGSALEHAIFEQQLLVSSISADKGLALARASGMEVFRIDATNLAASVARLAHPQEVIDDVENWVRLGAVVEIPLGLLSYEAWEGSVWKAEDPATGASAYLIAGGLAGGSTAIPPDNWILDFLADALNAPNSPIPNADPLSGVSITKLGATDDQSGEVDKVLPNELGVLVRDRLGNPVQGASVTFEVTEGGGMLVDVEAGGEATAVTVETNEVGIATVPFRLGQHTNDDPLYVQLHPDDDNVTQALNNEVEAIAASRSGALVLDAPFRAIAVPGPATTLLRTNPQRLRGKAATWADSISVRAQDEFENPVSNVEITFSMSTALLTCDPPVASFENGAIFDNRVDDTGRLKACPVYYPVLGDCGSASYSVKTSVLGASAGVILGSTSGASYIVSITAPGLNTLSATYDTLNGCMRGPSVDIFTSMPTNEFGQTIAAARAGEQFGEPIPLTILWWDPDYEIRYDSGGNPYVYYLSTGVYKPVDGTVTFNVSNGGSATDAFKLSATTYGTMVTTGPPPAQNIVGYSVSNVVVTVPTVDGREPATFSAGGALTTVWGLEPVIPEIIPTPIPLGPTGRTAVPGRATTSITPDNYVARSAEVDLLQDGEWVDYAIASRVGNGAIRIPRGYPFDLSKTYEAQLTLNRGSTSQVKSDKVPLKLTQQIFTDYSPSVFLSQEVDALNQRTCPVGSEFTFTTTQSAIITLTFKKIGSVNGDGSPNFDSETKLIDGQEYAKGEHSLSILPTDLIPGDYVFELEGVSLVDGHDETLGGNARSEFTVRDVLPVGHAIVKGVDLFEGHLVVMREDFNVPARGVPLDFRRTYSSNNDKKPGPLGIGWTHNWDSKVIISSCGEVIVIGGEGSGMRFVDDGAGGLRPLRGYHGSLVANHVDGSFDFYSKGGMRYHYKNFGAARFLLDFISDPNGNVVKATYDTSAGRAKIISVVDSAGRAIGFHWENRIFTYTSGDVITSVTGPDGISVEFEYDALGNLIRASREAGTSGAVQEERYGYAVGPTFSLEERHLLTSVVNTLNGATTQYEYKKAAIGIGPAIRMESYYVYRLVEPEGGETFFQVDLAGLESRGPPTMTSVVIDPRGKSTTYTLNQYGSPLSIEDPEGNVTSMTWSATDVLMESRKDGNNVTTFFLYDEHGNPTEESVDVQDFDGQSHRYTVETTYWPPSSFDPPYIKDRVRTREDRNGHVTEYRYDARGNLVEEKIAVQSVDGGPTTLVTKHVYDSRGDRRSTTDPRNFTTSFEYDALGNLNVSKDPLGGVTTTNWSVRSLATRVTDPLGRFTTYDYDRLGRVTKKTYPAVNTVSSEERTIYDDRANTQIQIDAEGRETKTTFDREGRAVRIDNAAFGAMVMEYDPAGNKILESNWFDTTSPRFDTVFSYDDAGRLVRKTEPLGKTTDYTLDGVGNILREVLTDAGDATFEPRVNEYDYDGLNRQIRVRRDLGPRKVEVGIRYDGNGNKVLEKDPLLRETSHRYDALNRLIETTEPEWKPGTSKITQFVYDGNGNRVQERQLNQPNAEVRTARYDELNRVTQTVDAVGQATFFFYDAVGNVVRETDPRKTVRRHFYDARNRRVRTALQLNRFTTPSREDQTLFAYDGVGNLVEEQQPNGNVVTHVYDGLNRRTRTDDTLGPVARYEYDARGNRTADVDANGNRTESLYDALNRMVRQELPESRTMQFTYDAAGNLTSQTNPRGLTTEMAYDRLNRLVKTTDPAPFRFTVEQVYDDAGNKIEEVDRRGNRTVFEYDDLNRVRKITDPGPLGYSQEFTYDAIGNRLTEKDRRGITTEMSYDSENRLTATVRAGIRVQTIRYDENGNRRIVVDANGNNTGYEWDERNLLIAENRLLAAITRYKLDEMGDRVEERDPEGRTIVRELDLRRRLLTETNGASETTESGYDGNGNRTRLRRAEGNEWTFVYDGANRLALVRDPDSNETRYGYDKNGNRTEIEDANHHLTGYEYDDLDRLSAMVYPDLSREEYEYDESGNRTLLGDPKNQVVRYEYDVLNRETARSYQNHAAPTGDDILSIATAYDPNGNPTTLTESYSGSTGTRITQKSYDDFDRLVSVTDAFGKSLRYAYDANGNRTEVRDPDGKITKYTFDVLNRAETVTVTGVGVTQYTYYRNSLLRTVTYPNGSSARNTFDLANRIQKIENLQNSALVSRYEYEYDTNGNRTKQVETRGAVAETTTYSFDSLDRLTEVVYPDNTTSYSYDAVGNRLTEQVVDLTPLLVGDRVFDYDERNRLRTITDRIDPAQSVDYLYDANGNQVQKTRGAVTTELHYDIRDQLTSVVQGSSTLGSYLYDYQGLRVQKTALSGATFRYVYDDQSVLLQTDTAGTTLAKYDYGPDRLLSMSHVVEGRQFYLFDGLGSVSDLMRPDGAIQASYKYDAWGGSRGGIGVSSNPFGFTGHERDETGLYYFKVRFYDPEVGIFLSEDPAKGDVDLPPSLHKYLYGYGNPTGYVDPNGQLFFIPILIYAGLSAIIAAEASIIHQEITEGKDLSTVDYAKAGKTGLAAGAIVASGGTVGVGATAVAVTAGVGFDVGHQTLVEGKDLADVDYERSFQVGGVAAGGGALLGAGLAAGGTYAAVVTGTGIGLGVVGATEGALNVKEGLEEGNYGKAAFGAAEVVASVAGIRALAKAQPKIIGEEPPPRTGIPKESTPPSEPPTIKTPTEKIADRSMTRSEWKEYYRSERMSRGPSPSWSKSRSDYWKMVGESELSNPTGNYSRTNVRRMLEGRSPRMRVEVEVRTRGTRQGSGVREFRDVPIELHHRTLPQRGGAGIANEPWNLEPAAPWAHEGMDPFRHTGYNLLRIIRGPNSY